MKKGAATYSNDDRTIWPGRTLPTPERPRKKQPKRRLAWVSMALPVIMTLMVCVTVNYRAYSELKNEKQQFETLGQQVEAVTSENLSLQEEIHYLKNDPDMIRREAQKFGFVPREKKVSVSGGK